MTTSKVENNTTNSDNSEQKKIIVTQVGSPIGRHFSQRLNLKGLGLDKMHKSSTLNDTPSIRGMIKKVHHLVTVQEV